MVYLPPGTLRGEGRLSVSLEPRSPGSNGLRTAEPFTEVRGGTIIGNVYRLSASSAGDEVRATPGATSSEIRLRPPFEVFPEPVLSRFVDGRWRALATKVFSSSIYGARLDGPGDYALVVNPGTAATERGGALGTLALALAPLALIAVALALIHLRRRGRAASGGTGVIGD